MCRWSTASATLFMGLACVGLARGQGGVLPLPPDKAAVGMNTPAISPDGRVVCFSYQGDLWTVPTDGGVAARLTLHDAHDAYPRWSPDGRWIAFASNRFATSGLNYDIFVMPAAGGEARRVTHHAANDYPTDWSSDGSSVLFQTARGVDPWQMYSVDVKTRVSRKLTIGDSPLRYGVYSADGRSIFFDRCGNIGAWWRPLYRGSANMDIYSRTLATGEMQRITRYDGTDLWPMASPDGKTLYYVTDEATPGTSSLVSRSLSGGAPKVLAKPTVGAVTWPNLARDGKTIVYTNDGRLYVVSTRSGGPKQINVVIRSDEKSNSVRRMALTSGATEVEVSPDGKTLVLVLRGELWTIPSDKGGDAKRLTDDPANDHDVVWSPDSAKLAFITDRKSNFDLYVIDAKGGAPTALTTDANDESRPRWSPDGKRIAFLRSGSEGGLYTVAVDGKEPAKRLVEAQGNNLFGSGIESCVWSPDSQWLAFSRRDTINTSDVWVVPAAGGKATNVTYYPGSNDSPQFTGDGKYLLYAAARDDRPPDLYCIPLQKEPRETDDKKDTEPPKADAKPAAPTKPVVVTIDFDEIEDRSRRITTTGVIGFDVTPDGKTVIGVTRYGPQIDYFAVPPKGGTVTRITTTGEGAGIPRITADGARFFTVAQNGTVKSYAKVGPGWQGSAIAFEARLLMDRRAELAQAFNEFWRAYNVGFYDPKMHGVNWGAVRARYEPLLAGVATKEEFALQLLSPMVGELNASHSEVSPATEPGGPELAELGIDFDQTYAGPGLKVTGSMPDGPNDDLGPKAKVGEYVMAINGVDVSWREDLYDELLDKSGKDVELLVNDKATRDGARTVKVKPVGLAKLRDLEYERKVKEARTLVTKLSDAKFGYIHIQSMDTESQRQFERDLWGRMRDKEALVLDIRNNGGGSTHDAILAQLSRTAYGYTQPRDGLRSTQPFRHWSKPTILLINEGSASDAEIFPSGFRALKLGKVVGVATPGYVIGTYSGHLPDGTSYRMPMWGWFTQDGADMENVGVKPDVTVEVSPDDIVAKRDRQLETAVDLLKQQVASK